VTVDSWGWNPFDCSNFPALINNYDGTPTSFGIGLRDHLAALATSPSPTPTSSTSTTQSPAPSPTVTPSPTGTPTPSPTSVTCAPASTPASTTATSTPTTTPSPTLTASPAATTTPTTTPPAGPVAGGTLGVSPSTNTSNAPYYWEEDLDLSSSAPITQLSVTVTVARTAGITYSGIYTTGPNGTLTTAHTDTGTAVTYTATLNPGATLPANTSLRVGAQYGGNGTAHPLSGDTYQVTATVGGQQMTSTGHF